MSDGQNNQSNPGGNAGGGQGNRRRRYRNHNRGQSSGQGQNRQGSPQQGDHRQHHRQDGNRPRRSGGRPLTTNQVLVKYDNLLEQHLITRRKYYEYFNRVDERQLYKLEKNFFDSIEHLRRFEANLEPWQREALEKRKTERYRHDLTYSTNHELPPGPAPIEVSPEEIEDPHFTDAQKEASQEYRDDTEESSGTFEDYQKLKGLT